jgi:glycerophosphoryl diester phosphodiesterase
VALNVSGIQIAFAQSPKLPKSKNTPIVVAHRGDHEHAPENTVQAIKDAIKAGADYVEIDLRTTIDSQLVIMHDADTRRMTGISKVIRSTTFDSLSVLRVKDVNHPEWGSFSIPTFDEILSTCKGKINIYLDFKDASVERAYEKIAQYKMQHRVAVYINSIKQFEDWRKFHPEIPLIISKRKSMSFEEFIKFANPDIMDGNVDELTKENVQLMKSLNKHIWPDVQSSTEGITVWDKAIQLGVSGMQSDKPEELIAYLKSQGLRK